MKIKFRSVISNRLNETVASYRPTEQERQENTKRIAANVRSLQNRNQVQSAPAVAPAATVTPAMAAPDKTSLAQTIARSFTEAVFAAASTNLRTPEELLLDELHSRHCPDELYPIWRVAALVRAAGFEVFALGEDGNEIKQRIGMLTLSPAAAYRPCKAIVLDSIQICTLAVNVCRVRPHAAMTAVILHELGHLLDTVPDTDAQREIQAWQMARQLLAVHNFYDVCQEWEFNRVETACLSSYGIR